MTAPGFDPAPLLAHYADVPAGTVAEWLGVSTRTVSRWRNGQSHISPVLADELACRCLRVHPGELWPDWWWAA